MTELMSKRWMCRWFGMMMIAALAGWVAVPTALAQSCADVEPDLSIRDCNGNGIDDADDIDGFSADVNANGIPDECDYTVCEHLWMHDNGDTFGAYGTTTPMNGLNGLPSSPDGIDRSFWLCPEGNAIIDRRGCETGSMADKTVQISEPASGPPQDGWLKSEYLRTFDGELDCGAAIYSLSFRFKIGQTIGGDVDWEFFIYDARSGARVVQIEMVSSTSQQYGVTAGQIMVRNPEFSPAPPFLDTSVEIALNTCYEIEVVLDNVEDRVQIYIDGTLRVETTRLDEGARRMDYFLVQGVENNGSAGIPLLKLDAFKLCLTGPALMNWEDCNNNCVDDYWDTENAIVIDENNNSIPDTCDGVESCACDGPAMEDCIWCNHEHKWIFSTSDGFEEGDVQCQAGWVRGVTTDSDNGEIVLSAAPNPFGTRAIKLNPKSSAIADPQGIRGPRTHDEQPDNPKYTHDPGLEYWEVDIAVDMADEDGEVFFVIWDECGDSFIHDDYNAANPSQPIRPDCFDDDPPTCFLIKEIQSQRNTYAFFNAGVRFRYVHGVREVHIFQDGDWNDNINQHYGSWNVNEPKHVAIKINNQKNLLTYWQEYKPGMFADAGQISLFAGTENPLGSGDRQVLLLNTSQNATAYFDNLKYHVTDDCDHDGVKDDTYLPGGQYAGYVPNADMNEDGTVDWCQDCNRNCINDIVEITNGWAQDCNGNWIPDECDTNTVGDGITRPVDHQGAPPCNPPWDDIGAYYSLSGGGSNDSNTNGIPDECLQAEIDAGYMAYDCNANGILDECDLSCAALKGECNVPGCGESNDCNGNSIPDDCEDCNGNELADECDITAGTSTDVNANDIPDDCEIDENNNGLPDDWEISQDPSLDCIGSNGVLDAYSPNGLIDVFDGSFPDCNGNRIADACDIIGGTSQDTNANGIPDECEEIPQVVLVTAVPEDTKSLWRSSNNAILLTFDDDIELPEPGNILIRQLLDDGNYGADMSADFTFSLEDEFGNADATKLLIKETGTVLGNTLWIGVQNTGDWANVQAFTVRYAVQVGDVNNDGRVMSNDLSPIFPKIPTAGAPATERCDINGDGRVMSNDLSPIFPKIPSNVVPKPTGHGL